MDVILRDGFNYVPEWNGNKSLQVENQINVDFEFISAADYAEMVTDGKYDAEKNWTTKCKRINNFTLSGKPCSALDVYKHKGLAEFYTELRDAYEKQSAVDKKK